MDRRLFLKNSLQVSAAACGAGFLSTNLFAQNKPIYIDNGGAAPQPHLTCYPNTENGRHQLYQLWVRDKHNRVLTSYRAHQTQKYPFFYPVAGPVSGLSLTAESAMPWPHHRSLFFGQDRVNGGNYWQEGLERGQICSQGPSFAKDESGQFKIDDVSAEIVDTCLWRQPNQEPIIEDSRRFLVKILDDRRYILDADIVLRALTTVTFEKTNHGLFGIRCAPELAPTGGGNMLSSEGKTTQRDTEGKPARWMAFYGPRKGIFAPNYNEHFSSSAILFPCQR